MRTILALIFLVLQSPTAIDQQAGKATEKTHESQEVPGQPPVTVYVTQNPPQNQEKGSGTHLQGGPDWAAWAGVLATTLAAFAAIKTLRAIEAQVREMRSTGQQTERLIQENIAQTTSLEKSVAEAARSATAMEGVAKSLENTAKASAETMLAARKQVRAYLVAEIGSGAYQERERNVPFQGKPLLVNCGMTPAKNVRHQVKAAILPVPYPPGFAFSVEISNNNLGNIIGAHKSAHVSGVVEDFVPDEQVSDVKIGKDNGLYVWGVVEYDDIFGDPHITQFCHLMTFLGPDNIVEGTYIPGHNDGN